MIDQNLLPHLHQEQDVETMKKLNALKAKNPSLRTAITVGKAPDLCIQKNGRDMHDTLDDYPAHFHLISRWIMI